MYISNVICQFFFPAQHIDDSYHCSLLNHNESNCLCTDLIRDSTALPYLPLYLKREVNPSLQLCKIRQIDKLLESFGRDCNVKILE